MGSSNVDAVAFGVTIVTNKYMTWMCEQSVHSEQRFEC